MAKRSCGFVWIIIKVLCGWVTAHVLLLCGLFVCVQCGAGCATAAAVAATAASLFQPSLILFLPSFLASISLRVWTANRDRLLCAAPVFGDDPRSHRWWRVAWWQIRPGGYKRPKQPAPRGTLCCAMSHHHTATHHAIKNDKCSHHLLPQANNLCLMLLKLWACPTLFPGIATVGTNIYQ